MERLVTSCGTKEILSLIYAPGSLDKMLNGHAYARAIRAHTLLQLALTIIIFKELDIDDAIDETCILRIK